ncbi:FtsB family cell division protein [Sandarakinorhabdus rubra]|uniref:FtsB family cell division protein n=1 Tax=Sandarakinorhabdus rubra TaxID=2672568 RepID=UPI0013DB7999|nr:septum formation initiator family protein [Sandarakinorhabdus rubra]
MAVRLTLQQMLARAALPALCMTVGGYFAFHAATGPTGYLAWRDYTAQRAKLEVAVRDAREQQVALQRRLVLLDPRHVDPDLADELVRRNLDLVKPDEVIVPLPPES